jgi:hypothetical protein
MDIRRLPIYPPGVPKWAKFWFHVLTLYIEDSIENVKDFKKAIAEGSLAFHAHPWTTTPDELLEAAMKEIRLHGQEITNGSFGCFSAPLGHTPRAVGGSDGHGTRMAPYCTVVTYVLADRNREDVYEALLENKTVIQCRRLFFSTNRKIAKEFEKEFNVKTKIVDITDTLTSLPLLGISVVSNVLLRQLSAIGSFN